MNKFISIFCFFFVMSLSTAATDTFNITVPNDGSQDGHHQTQWCFMVGNFNGWDATNPVYCSKIDSSHYTVTLDESTFMKENGVPVTFATMQYLYLNGRDWAYVMKNSDGSNANYLTYSGSSHQNDTVSYWLSGGYECWLCFKKVSLDFFAPKSVTECYVAGSFNNWKAPGYIGVQDSTSTKMTLIPARSNAEGNYFSITIFAQEVVGLAFYFSSGPSWLYAQKENEFHLSDPNTYYQYFDGVMNPPQVTFARVYNSGTLKTINITATVPDNTNELYIKGLKNGIATDFIAGNKNSSTTFTFTVSDVDLLEYKYFNAKSDANVELKADGTKLSVNRIADAQQVTIFTDNVLGLFTSVQDIALDPTLMYLSNGSIMIENLKSRVEIFDIYGRNIQDFKLNGNFVSKVLSKGFYVIRIDGTARKIVVK